MTRSSLFRRLALAALAFGLQAASARAADRPNILWLTCEDISPYLGCYGCKEAQTPNLDRLAAQGVRYTRAYANAPVCAVARSTLLSGLYATTLGTHQMRSVAQLPPEIPAYPKLLRQAGYYCTNNNKKDYNSNFETDATLWDDSTNKAHYRNRKPGQPFFAVFNLAVTHEAQLSDKALAGYVARKQIPPQPRVDPASLALPPYHPDLPEIRQDWARLHDLITLMDRQVGERLAELEQSGAAEDTIVFFYSDHGGTLSRAKRYIYNTGTQVPFLVRVPKPWQRFAPAAPGAAADRLVSFVDFPKTALALAGVTPPALMQGRVFLGPQAEPAPDTVHFYRDRMAERYDFSRAVTDGRFTFVRNFMPHRPLGRDSRYGFDNQANWGAWERHFEAGLCNEAQSQFFRAKPAVQLFDTQSDPWHVANLAERREQRERAAALEADLDRWMVETRDVGLIPEPLFADLAGPGKPFATLYDYARSDASYPVARLLALAKSASLGAPERAGEYLAALADAHPVARHWGAYGLFQARPARDDARAALRHMLSEDPHAGNRVIAAQALGVCGDADAAFEALLKEARAASNGYVLLFALNAFQYTHTDGRLTQADWRAFNNRKAPAGAGADPTGFGYAGRIASDALALWPKRRTVDGAAPDRSPQP